MKMTEAEIERFFELQRQLDLCFISRREHGHPISDYLSWQPDTANERKIWDEITAPENMRPLEAILTAAKESGGDSRGIELWTRILQECRRKSQKDPPVPPPDAPGSDPKTPSAGLRE